MNKQIRKFRYDRLIILLALLAIIVFLIYFSIKAVIFVIGTLFPNEREVPEDIRVIENYDALLPAIEVTDPTPQESYQLLPLIYDDNSAQLGSAINSRYGILYRVDDRKVLARKGSQERMYPASMTKVMTLIVALENIENLDATFTMTFEIINPLYLQNATVTGLSSGETVPLIDLLYGIILPSGADATVAIAQYVSESEEEFVKLMNEKAEEMGLLDTHFTNTSGLHDSNHYTTAYDMALILDYAIHNETARKILSTYKYVTTPTEQHPDGIEFYSTMFNKVRSDSIEGMEITGGKTGYTYEARHCLVSFATKNGKTYIAVTGYGENKYSPIYDMIDMYTKYIN